MSGALRAPSRGPWSWKEPECRTGLSTSHGVTAEQMLELVEMATTEREEEELCVVDEMETCWVTAGGKQGEGSFPPSPSFTTVFQGV